MNSPLSTDLGMHPVYPIADLNAHPGPYGLTKRELFAAMAMQGMMAAETPADEFTAKTIGRRAVAFADGLLAALEPGT